MWIEVIHTSNPFEIIATILHIGSYGMVLCILFTLSRYNVSYLPYFYLRVIFVTIHHLCCSIYFHIFCITIRLYFSPFFLILLPVFFLNFFWCNSHFLFCLIKEYHVYFYTAPKQYCYHWILLECGKQVACVPENRSVSVFRSSSTASIIRRQEERIVWIFFYVYWSWRLWIMLMININGSKKTSWNRGSSQSLNMIIFGMLSFNKCFVLANVRRNTDSF